MAQLSIAMLTEQALGQLDKLTFNLANAECKASANGNVGFKVKTDQGKVITFWTSTADATVKALDDAGNFQVIAGTGLAAEVLPDGTTAYGLIDKSSTSRNSFWK